MRRLLYFACAFTLFALPASATTYYVCAATGSPCNASDSNAGTSKTATWLHSPGMANCSGTCATVTPQPGDNIIFRGGDTWHYGNSSAVPYTGITPSGNGSNCDAGNACGISIGGPSAAWGSNAGSPIYYGVDQTWYSGSSWARPIMNGDNTPGTSGVSSCTHDQSAFSFIQSWTGSTNWIIDNFEFTGLCWSGANNTTTYINNANHFTSATTNRIIEHAYFHGWTHVTFSCSAGPSGNCEAGWGAVQGPSASTDGIGDTIQYSVFDGSDTDEQSYSAGLFGMNIVQYNYVGFMAQGFILNNNHSFHDNLFDSINGLSDGQAHGNVIENNTEFAAHNVFYNNIIRNSFPGGAGCGNVQVWIAPTQTDYDFNNLIYGWDSSCGAANYWDMINASQGGTNGWTAQVFNNTWVMNNTDAGNPSSTTVNYTNNHCIIPGGGAASACFSSNGGTTNYTTNTVQTPTTATSQGYTSSETFAYSPTSGGSTIGAGTNETSSYCSALTGSGDAVLQAAGAACESGTGYACTYNASNHTVSCPAQTLTARPSSGAWDAGAYQFESGSNILSLTTSGTGIVTTSPAGISCPVTCSNSFSGSVTLTATASGGSVFSGWYGGGCSGTLPCTINISAATSVQAVFATTGTPSLLTQNLTATSTSCSIASNIVTINGTNTFGSGAWVGLSGFTNCTQLNGQVLLTNSSTTTSKVVGTLYNKQKTVISLSNLSNTADTTGLLQGQGWNPFVIAPFPLCNGSPSCAVTPTAKTWAYDFSIPCNSTDNAPCSPIVALADYTTSSDSPLVPSLSGETNDRAISLNDGSGDYMFALTHTGRQDIYSLHLDSSFCNNVPCPVPDVTSVSNVYTSIPDNYGLFSRNPAINPGTHKAIWRHLNISATCGIAGNPDCSIAPVLQHEVLSYSAGAVTSISTTNDYFLSTCPDYAHLTVSSGLTIASAPMIDNLDNNMLVSMDGGLQGTPDHHDIFVISITSQTCQKLDTEGMTGTNLRHVGVTSGHAGTSYTTGDVITLPCGGQATVTAPSGIVTALAPNTATGTNCYLGRGFSTTGGTGTGLEADVTGIGSPGTVALIYPPIAPCTPGNNTTISCESPFTTTIDVFGIHNCNMLSNGLYANCSGWGPTGQGCSGCDYVVWTLGSSPALVGSTNANLNGHDAVGYNWWGTASNPHYYENQPPNGTTDATCSAPADCYLLYTLPSGGAGGTCATSPGGSQMHSSNATPTNDDSYPVEVTTSFNVGGGQVNPPGLTGALCSNSLFAINKSGSTTWYAHHYENSNNSTENFEGLDTICAQSPDGVFAICAEDMYGTSSGGTVFTGNTGLSTDTTGAAFVQPFAFMMNQGAPAIAVPAPPTSMFAKTSISIKGIEYEIAPIDVGTFAAMHLR